VLGSVLERLADREVGRGLDLGREPRLGHRRIHVELAHPTALQPGTHGSGQPAIGQQGREDAAR
jgi:hypothetical protein